VGGPSPPISQRFSLQDRLSAFRPKRLSRAARALGKWGATVTIFVAALGGGALLHLDTEVGRGAGRVIANAVLAPLFDGKIEVGEIEQLGLERARIKHAKIYDPSGRHVIEAEGIVAEVGTLALLSSLFTGDGPVELELPVAHIERARVSLLDDREGIPTIAHAFIPADKSPSRPGGRPFLLDIIDVHIAEVEVESDLALPFIARLRDVRGRVTVRGDRMVAVDVKGVAIATDDLIPARLDGVVDYHLRVDLRPEEAFAAIGVARSPPVVMWADYAGTIGAIPVTASGVLEGVRLDAQASFPSVAPDALKALIPQVPIEVPMRGRARVSGMLPENLRAHVSATVGEGGELATVSADGGVSFTEELRVLVGADVKGLDPRMLARSLPEARIDGQAKVTLTLRPDELDPLLSVELATDPTSVFGQSVPAIDALIDLHHGEVVATSSLREPGVSVEAKTTISDGKVAFSADLVADDLSESPRLAGRLKGAARARVDGKYQEGELDAKVSATVSELWTTSAADPRAALERGTVVATLHGPPLALTVDAHVSGTGLVAAGERIDALQATASGSLLSPRVTLDVQDAERGAIKASGDVSVLSKEVRDLTFEIERAGESASGTIATLELSEGPALRGVEVRGGSIGRLSGSLSISGDELLGDVRARGLDLSRAQTLFNLPVSLGGLANLDAKLERSAGGRKGSLELELARGRILLVDGISARVSARFDGKEVEASGFLRLVDDAAPLGRDAGRLEREEARLCDGPIAEIRVANLLGTLKGPLLSAATWRGATGSADLALDHVDLGCVERRLSAELWPFERARGKVTARAHVSRAEGDREPSISDLVATTIGLELKGWGWSSDQLDLAVRGSYDGKDGETRAEAAVYRQETNDVLAWLGATVRDHVGDLLATPRSGPAAISIAPMELTLEVPTRDVDGFALLPYPLGALVPDFEGVIGGAARLSGTLSQPAMRLNVDGDGLLARSLSAQAEWVPPIDVELRAAYEPLRTSEELHARLSVKTPTSEVVKALAKVSLPASSLGASGPLPWSATLEADLFGLPFESIPTLADRGLSGLVSGRVAVHGLNQAPWASIDLSSSRLLVQDHELKVKLDATLDEEGEAHAKLAVFDDPRRDGDAREPSTDELAKLRARLGAPRLEVEAKSAMRWLGKALPEPLPSQPGSIAVYARDFELGALYPAFSSVLSKLEGTMTGNARLSWQDLTRPTAARLELFEERCEREGGASTPAEDHACPSDATRTEIPAPLELSDLIAYIPSLGQELHHGRASVTLKDLPTGEQRVTLEDFSVLGSTGRVLGGAKRGEADTLEAAPPHMDVRGLSIARAGGTLVIPEEEPLPITLEGVSFGKASGRVDFELRPAPGVVRTAVKITGASFELPASTSRDLQPMGPARGVLIVGATGPTEEVGREEATRWQIDVDLGPTRIESSALNVTVASNGVLKLELADRLEAEGEIELQQGSVVVNKKKFEIDRGLVRLRRQEVGNPYVNLTAHWEAGSDLRVYVDYQGLLSPITDDKIRFRADPPVPKDEIMQMLLLGQSTAVNAVNLVGTLSGTVATTFANDLLSAATGSFFQQLTVSIGSSESESSVAASWHGSDRVTVGAGFRQLEETTDRATTARCGDIYLEWRVSDRWSLRGSSGYCADEEAAAAQDGISVGLDALWQYRY
jgi:translocation and assembly module TamB